MNLNKRGQTTGWFWAVIFVLLIFGIIAAAYFFLGSSVFSKISQSASAAVETTSESFKDILGKSFVWMDYIFGGISKFLIETTSSSSATIITIAVWLLIFLTFGDIFATFSTFNKGISWAIAFLLAVIAANLKAVIVISTLFIGLFSFLGTLAVLGGLAAAFVVFIGLNWGISSLGPMIMRRKAMRAAEKSSIEAEAGGEVTAGAIKGMKKVGEALREK